MSGRLQILRAFALIKRVSLDEVLSKRLSFSTFNHFRLSLLL
jgi:hypothetical protein